MLKILLDPNRYSNEGVKVKNGELSYIAPPAELYREDYSLVSDKVAVREFVNSMSVAGLNSLSATYLVDVEWMPALTDQGRFEFISTEDIPNRISKRDEIYIETAIATLNCNQLNRLGHIFTRAAQGYNISQQGYNWGIARINRYSRKSLENAGTYGLSLSLIHI